MDSMLLGLTLVLQLIQVVYGLSLDNLGGCAGVISALEDKTYDTDVLCVTLEFANRHGCFCNRGMEKLTEKAMEICGRGFWLPAVSFCHILRDALPEYTEIEKMQNISGSYGRFSKSDPPKCEQISVISVTSTQKVIAAGSILLVSCLLLCPCFRPKKNLQSHQPFADKTSSSEAMPSHELQVTSPLHSLSSQQTIGGAMVFTMAQITKATRNFSPSLRVGQGGFGTVYRGHLGDGQEVAIKRAKKDTFKSQRTAEFRNEVSMLANIEHQNLVRLIGYCEQDTEHILVTEYVTNGNLREHLDGLRGTYLDFSTRLEIAVNVAHGLTYLHLYSGDINIIHRDVKSSNILLTENFKAKVADFGFSRFGPIEEANETHVSTGVKGTAGYLDPEYLKTYQLTPKSDVYSFGVLLVEIMTGRRPIELRKDIDERITIRWAFKKANEGKVAELLDPAMKIGPGIASLAEKIFALAFDCSAPTRSDRPTMKQAQERLWEIRSLYYQTSKSTENNT
eukprot:TRINITY_DN3525_c0_g1_i1.p1 TRINITY_DN3525_c0_g1~~TRINITY_DN3525_c0_g1_i1.p1  ORF type:complete len:508 (+),score=86.24 TRINITY_DN3525_c0_g1_i1:262-1785(+)